jgi:hypothetical protein
MLHNINKKRLLEREQSIINNFTNVYNKIKRVNENELSGGKVDNLFQLVQDYIDKNEINYEVDYNPNQGYIRFNYWERVNRDFETFLQSLGFELGDIDDEDKGKLFFYQLQNF